MQIRAIQKHIRISPRKLRLIANFLNGLKFNEAAEQLKYLPQKGARWAEKVLFSAMHNAENNFNLKRDNLYIKSAVVEEGARLKRWRPVSRGMAHPFIKPSSHLRIILSEIEAGEEKRSKTSAQKIKTAKEVKLKKEAKQEIKTAKSISKKDEKSLKEKAKSRSVKIFDQRRKGKNRDKQHLDKVNLKQTGGSRKQVFRRKAV